MNLLILGQHLKNLNRINLGTAAFHTLAIAILWVFDRLNVLWVLGFYVMHVALTWSLCWRGVRSRLGLVPRATPGLSGEILRYGLWMHPGIVLMFLHLRIDLFLVKRLCGLEAVGHYSLAVLLTESLWWVADSISVAVLPNQAERNADQAAAVTAKACRAILAGGTVFACLLGLASGPLICNLYGPTFAAAIAPFCLLLPGVIVLGLRRPCISYLHRIGRPGLLSGFLLLEVVLNVALNILWIPRWGLAGSAAASSISYAVGGFLTLGLFAKASGMTPSRIFRPEPGELSGMLRTFKGIVWPGHRPTRDSS